jgi:tetratricopeptide (TPR) repeat protein
MAYYNRALLRFETGDYAGSVEDFDAVLNQHPNFIPGYYSRSEAKRKMRDNAGADRDYWTAFEIEERLTRERKSGKPGSDSTADTASGLEGENTRELSDKNINKFNRLVVYDKEEERKNKYQSDVRGRVQDKNVRVDLEPQFVLTYYEKADPVKKIIYYDKSIEDFNTQMILPRRLRLTNEEAALTEDQIASHFASIDDFSAGIDRDSTDFNAYFGRAIDFMLVQNFAEAINDYTKVIDLHPEFMMAYFNRAVVRYKQLDYTLSHSSAEPVDISSMSMNLTIGPAASNVASNDPASAKLKDNQRAYEHEQVMRDYDKVIQLNPNFVYAFFNRGNLRCAQRDFRAGILDYNEAINRDPDFAEAYFNRGLARLSQGDTNRGIADLSKAGELGIINAYSIIKRMTSN